MKKVLSVLIALAMVLGMTACGGAPITDTPEPASTPATTTSTTPAAPAATSETPAATEAGEKVIRAGLDLEYCDTLDVWDNSYIATFFVSDLIFDRLVDKDPETMELQLNLLEDWPTLSDDKLTYTFKLKKGVKWSDGVELTANDVAFSLDYFYAQDTASVNTWLLDAIEGTQEMLDGKADHLSGVEVIDDYTFKVTLSYPYSAFLSILATSMMPVLPAHLRAEAGDAWGVTQIPVGSGAYICTEFEQNQKIVLVPNKDYHGFVPNCDRLEILHMDNSTALMEFEAGNIDYCAVPSDLTADYAARFPENFHEQVVAGTIRLSLNVESEPLNDPRVRKALYMAIDRDAICDGYFSGNVKKINGIIPDGIPGFDADAPGYEHDVEGAKALLAEAGYPNGIEITATVRDASSDRFVLELIQSQVKEAGITFNIDKVDAATVSEMRNGNKMQVFFYDWYADYMDADMFLYPFFYSTNSDSNSIALHDADLDAKLDLARTLDGEEKTELYKSIDRDLAYDRVIFIPLYQDKTFYLASSRVSGVFTKKDMLYSFMNASVNE